MSERDMCMKKLMAACFAVFDTVLFLDTHPENKAALAAHNRYVAELNKLKKEYSEKYGMLTAFSENDGNRWSWIDSPWPWEG